MKQRKRRSMFLEVSAWPWTDNGFCLCICVLMLWLMCRYTLPWGGSRKSGQCVHTCMKITVYSDELFALLNLFSCIGNWKEELQKYISPDQLPQAYGGTRCEPDPYCSNYVNLSLSLSLSLSLTHHSCNAFLCRSTRVEIYQRNTTWLIWHPQTENQWRELLLVDAPPTRSH